MMLFSALGLSGAGAAAAGGTAAATAGTAATGLSLSSLLQGTLTVLGVMSSFAAGAAEADALNMQARDADAEQNLETLQGIERRQSIKREMADALGAQDTAYAASGVDLSFGTARQARQDAYREADLALTGDAGTEMVRKSRLSERAANYRSAAKRAKRMGMLKGIMGGIQGLQSITERY